MGPAAAAAAAAAAAEDQLIALDLADWSWSSVAVPQPEQAGAGRPQQLLQGVAPDPGRPMGQRSLVYEPQGQALYIIGGGGSLTQVGVYECVCVRDGYRRVASFWWESSRQRLLVFRDMSSSAAHSFSPSPLPLLLLPRCSHCSSLPPRPRAHPGRLLPPPPPTACRCFSTAPSLPQTCGPSASGEGHGCCAWPVHPAGGLSAMDLLPQVRGMLVAHGPCGQGIYRLTALLP